MTLAEFKAWLEGFEHSFAEEGNGAPPQYVPNATQWAMIKEKLALVAQSPIPIPRGHAVPNGQKVTDWYKTYIQNLPQSVAEDRVLSGQAL